MKTLGLDLGTNSIGWSIRNTFSAEMKDSQFEKFGVTTFEKGVGEGKSGEFSFAAQRTKKRALRRLYQARKYRLWKTLEIMVELEFCPMTIENLNRWRKYDKSMVIKGEGGRAYPVNDRLFDSWIKLDFNGDGKPDYSSPYQLRAELIEIKLDLSKESDRYKIGRALYHIAQRRGFKSSRKDVVTDVSGDKQDAKSEIKKETEFEKNLQNKFGKSLADFPTIGSSLAFIEQNGYRIRLEWIQNTFRKHYKDECTKIFEFQEIGLESELYKRLIESRKNYYNGSIFKQRPLRSQKGLVGKCTLETRIFKDQKGKVIISGKPRCPISHPEFEEFRALSFLNNIQYRSENGWLFLSRGQKTEIYNKLFLRSSKPNFLFIEIRKVIEKQIGQPLDYGNKTINYSDKTNVSACPLSAYLLDIFGENWKTNTISTILSGNTKNGKKNIRSYTADDIWHVLFSFDNEDMVSEFSATKLGLDEQQRKKFVRAWNSCKEGYSMLSLYAIKKINQFLRQGFIYTEAVLLANIPQIVGNEIWEDVENQNLIKDSISELIKKNREGKKILGIVNNLVAENKSLQLNGKIGYKDPDYTLTDSDKDKIIAKIIETYGKRTWEFKTENKSTITETVIFLFQCTFQNGFITKTVGEERYHVIDHNGQLFHKSTRNQFYKLPRLVDTIQDFLKDNFSSITEKQLSKLYHPSMIEIYAPSSPDQNDGKVYLQSPKTGAFKNPMAMRTLYELRKLINYLIKTRQIDEDTRIVVETARELNDANKRWAIEAYQRQRQYENNEFAEAIRALIEKKELEKPPKPGNIEAIEKLRLWYDQIEQEQVVKGKGEYGKSIWSNHSTTLLANLSFAKTAIDKYRLWNEQKCTCIYTGRIISISDLFDENKTDFEHTIPRSISFDNSLVNQTVCYANYNRNVKKNQIPTALPNYEVNALGYSAIKPRLKAWEDKVEHLKSMVEFWKGKSKSAATKEFRDNAIRQRHLWQMDLDYWRNKLERFTMTEVTSGFKNSQLVDTQLISKYALHYLRTAFNTVDVQKGTVTSVFRKILGVQSVDEKKNRDKHSHHAIDATILTLIPYPSKREKILKYFFELDEIKKLHDERNQKDRLFWLENELKQEIRDLNLPNTNDIIKTIDDQILINNIIHDKTLISGKKVVRHRGKTVHLLDKNGMPLLDQYGNPVPKISQGDCIRGQLHKETFFGAIKEPIKNLDTKPIIENKELKYEAPASGEDRIIMVTRKLVKEFTSEKDLECIIDPSIKNVFIKTIKERQSQGLSFKEAINQEIWLLDRNGLPIKKDKNGRMLQPVRHVRVKVAAGRGFMTKEKSLVIKKQTYPSKHEYKQFYYAQNADNYLFLLYQSQTKTGLKRTFKIINFLEISKTSIKNPRDLWEYPEYVEIVKGKSKSELIYSLSAIIKKGTKVLVKASEKEELALFSIDELSKRLYRVYKFNEMGSTGYVYIQFHIEARPDKDLGDGDTLIDINKYQSRLKLSSDNFNCLVEGKDFEIRPDGEIIFIS